MLSDLMRILCGLVVLVGIGFGAGACESNHVHNDAEDVMDDAADDAEDVADDAGDAVEDAADDVEDALD